MMFGDRKVIRKLRDQLSDMQAEKECLEEENNNLVDVVEECLLKGKFGKGVEEALWAKFSSCLRYK